MIGFHVMHCLSKAEGALIGRYKYLGKYSRVKQGCLGQAPYAYIFQVYQWSGEQLGEEMGVMES